MSRPSRSKGARWTGAPTCTRWRARRSRFFPAPRPMSGTMIWPLCGRTYRRCRRRCPRAVRTCPPRSMGSSPGRWRRPPPIAIRPASTSPWICAGRSGCRSSRQIWSLPPVVPGRPNRLGRAGRPLTRRLRSRGHGDGRTPGQTARPREPPTSLLDPRTSLLEPRTSPLDPRTSLLNPRTSRWTPV